MSTAEAPFDLRAAVASLSIQEVRIGSRKLDRFLAEEEEVLPRPPLAGVRIPSAAFPPHPADETVEEPETPEATRAERIVGTIRHAEFGSANEYMYGGNRSGDGLRLGNSEWGDIHTDLTIISSGLVDSAHTHAVFAGINRHFRVPDDGLTYGSLNCLIGQVEGRFIIQGAGTIHRNYRHGGNESAFKLVFSSEAELKDFVTWLEDNPAEALSSVVERIKGNVGGAIQTETTISLGLSKIYSPYRWIGRLGVRDINTGEAFDREFDRPILDQDGIYTVEYHLRSRGGLNRASLAKVRQMYEAQSQEKDEDVKAGGEYMIKVVDAYREKFGHLLPEEPPEPVISELERILRANTIDVDPRNGDLRFQLLQLLAGREAARLQATPQQLLGYVETLDFPVEFEMPIIKKKSTVHLRVANTNVGVYQSGDMNKIFVSGEVGTDVPVKGFVGKGFSVELYNDPDGGLATENAVYDTDIPLLPQGVKDKAKDKAEYTITHLNKVITEELEKEASGEDFIEITGQAYEVAGFRLADGKVQVDFRRAP